MTDRVYLTVASYCLVEAIEKFKGDGCVEFGLGMQDGNWLLSFNLPCKKMSAPDNDALLPEEDRPPVIDYDDDDDGDVDKYHAKAESKPEND